MNFLLGLLRGVFTYQKGRPAAVVILLWTCTLSVLSEITVEGGLREYSGAFTRPFVSARQLLFDGYQKYSPRVPLSQPVTIVAIDEASLSKIGQWPWPRNKLADLIAAIGAYQPAAIGLDMYMPERDQTSPDIVAANLPADAEPGLLAQLQAMPSHEALLAEALFTYPTVLGAAGFDFETYTTSAGLRTIPLQVIGNNPLPFVRKFDAVLASLPELQAAAWGQAVLSVDLDFGVVRRIPLVVAVGDELVPGLAMEMLRVATGSEAVTMYSGERGVESVDIAELSVPTQPGGDMWLHFAEASSTAGRYVSAARVLAGEVDPDQLNGKLVLLGLTGFGLNDMRTTALGELVPGIEIQAQLLETMFDGHFIVRPWWMKWVEIGGILAIGLFLVWFIPRTDSPLAKFLQTVPRAYLWLTLGINLILAGIGLMLFRNLGLLFDTASAFLIFSAIIGSLVSSALIQIDRVNKAREEQQQELRETAKLVAGTVAASFSQAAEAANNGPDGQPVDRLTAALGAEAARQPQFAEQLDARTIALISRAALHRDMGMVQVPREHLESPDPLPPDAHRRLRQHTEVGRLALTSVRELLEREHSGISPELEHYLEVMRDTVDSHHERWDGQGYPRGLAGEDIPLAGRLVALVDTYQSLVSERPYRPARSHDAAMDIIRQGSGSQFDPRLVECLVTVMADRQAATQPPSDTPPR